MTNKNLLKTLLDSLLYLVGSFLVVGGLLFLLWLARPYIILFAFSGQKAALEKKAEQKSVGGNYIIIPSVLVDAPILEGMNPKQLSKGIVRVQNTPPPGGKGNFILEGHNLAEVGLIKPNNLFSLLEVIGNGSRVYIYWQNKRYVYEVTDKTVKDVRDGSIYKQANNERLTLVTCVSTWSTTIYTNNRTIVVCRPLF
jgi:LPXTG-site transpeptidase (sortase) family protein